jgi:hypothetical protein
MPPAGWAAPGVARVRRDGPASYERRAWKKAESGEGVEGRRRGRLDRRGRGEGGKKVNPGRGRRGLMDSARAGGREQAAVLHVRYARAGRGVGGVGGVLSSGGWCGGAGRSGPLLAVQHRAGDARAHATHPYPRPCTHTRAHARTRMRVAAWASARRSRSLGPPDRGGERGPRGGEGSMALDGPRWSARGLGGGGAPSRGERSMAPPDIHLTALSLFPPLFVSLFHVNIPSSVRQSTIISALPMLVHWIS